MTEEERILRLENAFSTLSELAAAHQQLIAGQQRRTARLEESFVVLTTMAQRHGESLDELRASQAESEHKIAALADAMIRVTEAQTHLTESQTQLTESQTQLAESQKQLAESQTHSDKRLDALIDIVRQWGNGRG